MPAAPAPQHGEATILGCPSSAGPRGQCPGRRSIAYTTFKDAHPGACRLWVADGMLTTIADATLAITLAVTLQKAVPSASVSDEQPHAEQQEGTGVPQTGVGRQLGMAAAAARPATTGDAGTGQKGLFGWCRKLGKRRQVASGAPEEQDDGAEQVSSPPIAV